jgi:hypothetical protein
VPAPDHQVARIEVVQQVVEIGEDDVEDAVPVKDQPLTSKSLPRKLVGAAPDLECVRSVERSLDLWMAGVRSPI